MSDHPTWCNQKHSAGANPKRQSHLNRWRSSQNILPMGVDIYPYNGNVIMTVHVTSNTPNGHAGKVGTVMGSHELRSFGRRLLEMADAADAEKTIH